jgi:probable HAF family extracellular repeat protein
MPTATTSDGFLLKDGHLTTLQFPGSTFTQAFGVNNEDDIVGAYQDAKGNTHGFSYDDGHYTTLDVPGATMTVINGINNFDNVVGFFVDAAGNTEGVVGAPLHSLAQNDDTTHLHHDTHTDHALT